MPNLRVRLYAENVSWIEGSVALTVYPGRANVSYIFSQNLANNRKKNAGSVGRVICLTRDHVQTKNERKENGKKDRLVTLLTRQTFLHLLQ